MELCDILIGSSLFTVEYIPTGRSVHQFQGRNQIHVSNFICTLYIDWIYHLINIVKTVSHVTLSLKHHSLTSYIRWKGKIDLWRLNILLKEGTIYLFLIYCWNIFSRFKLYVFSGVIPCCFLIQYFYGMGNDSLFKLAVGYWHHTSILVSIFVGP